VRIRGPLVFVPRWCGLGRNGALFWRKIFVLFFPSCKPRYPRPPFFPSTVAFPLIKSPFFFCDIANEAAPCPAPPYSLFFRASSQILCPFFDDTQQSNAPPLFPSRMPGRDYRTCPFPSCEDDDGAFFIFLFLRMRKHRILFQT